MFFFILYSALQYCSVVYCTVLYCTVLYCRPKRREITCFSHTVQNITIIQGSHYFILAHLRSYCTPFHTIVEPILHICLTHNKINGRFTHSWNNPHNSLTKWLSLTDLHYTLTMHIKKKHWNKFQLTKQQNNGQTHNSMTKLKSLLWHNIVRDGFFFFEMWQTCEITIYQYITNIH